MKVCLRLFLLLIIVSSNLFAQNEVPPFDEGTIPEPPDYSKTESWAALPDKNDFADLVPAQCNIKDAQGTADADVFFIYPTIFTKRPAGENYWNADINDEALNKEICESTIKYQSGIFNAAGKVYVPLYRQAHIRVYFNNDKASAQKAFDVAYDDVRNAFEYYMRNYNNARPIIIASHSQGTHHAVKLLKEYFDKKPLLNQLVAAYLVGGDARLTDFEILKPCDDSTSTGCYVTWRTYSTDYEPKSWQITDEPVVCTNPLTWKNDKLYASRRLNRGAVLRDFDKVVERVCDAQTDTLGFLRINKPHVRGKIFINFKNYHKADYNLFYMNVRENAITRVNSFLKSQTK